MYSLMTIPFWRNAPRPRWGAAAVSFFLGAIGLEPNPVIGPGLPIVPCSAQLQLFFEMFLARHQHPSKGAWHKLKRNGLKALPGERAEGVGGAAEGGGGGSAASAAEERDEAGGGGSHGACEHQQKKPHLCRRLTQLSVQITNALCRRLT
jgi:hypothetical protein